MRVHEVHFVQPAFESFSADVYGDVNEGRALHAVGNIGSTTICPAFPLHVWGIEKQYRDAKAVLEAGMDLLAFELASSRECGYPARPSQGSMRRSRCGRRRSCTPLC
jgi:hypothetical protein